MSIETWEDKKTDPAPIREKLAELEARGKHYDSEFERLNVSLLGLNSKMESGFESLYRKIDEFSKSRQITWPLIFTAVGTLIGIFTVGALLINGALRPQIIGIESNQNNLARVEESVFRVQGGVSTMEKTLNEHRVTLAFQLGELKSTKDFNAVVATRYQRELDAAQEDITTTSTTIAALEARIEEMRKQLDAVDHGGSRLWDKNSPPTPKL